MIRCTDTSSSARRRSRASANPAARHAAPSPNRTATKRARRLDTRSRSTTARDAHPSPRSLIAPRTRGGIFSARAGFACDSALRNRTPRSGIDSAILLLPSLRTAATADLMLTWMARWNGCDDTVAVATAATTGLNAVRSGCADRTALVARSATKAATRGSASAEPARLERPSGVSRLCRASISTTPRTVRATPSARSVEETMAGTPRVRVGMVALRRR